MKALSVVAPAGSLISQGIKTLEIRRWIPDLTPDEDLIIVENNQFLTREGDEDTGVAVAIVNIITIRPFTPEDISAACASSYEKGWFAWEIANVRTVQAFTVRAARKIYQLNVNPSAFS